MFSPSTLSAKNDWSLPAHPEVIRRRHTLAARLPQTLSFGNQANTHSIIFIKTVPWSQIYDCWSPVTGDMASMEIFRIVLEDYIWFLQIRLISPLQPQASHLGTVLPSAKLRWEVLTCFFICKQKQWFEDLASIALVKSNYCKHCCKISAYTLFSSWTAAVF